MAIELEPDGITVNAVSPGFRTNLNGYAGTEAVEQGDGPTATFTRWNNQIIPW